jgi:hypothetical protein
MATIRPCSAAALLLSFVLGACQTPVQLPPDFVQLEGYDEFLAVTGDDARFCIRELEAGQAAPLDFWAQAVEFDFTQQRGYQLVGKGALTNRDGRGGHWIECLANVSGERVGYLIAVWVSGATVHVAEFAAREDVFKVRVDAVRAALTTVSW